MLTRDSVIGILALWHLAFGIWTENTIHFKTRLLIDRFHAKSDILAVTRHLYITFTLYTKANQGVKELCNF